MHVHRHPINIAKRIKWKLIPPPIPSPYLYYPFKGELTRILGGHARHSWRAVEFGSHCGFTASIIARNLPAGGHLTAYSFFDQASIAEIKDNLRLVGVDNNKVTLIKADVREVVKTLEYFDLLWLDALVDHPHIDKMYEELLPHIKRGAVVLSEGIARVGPRRIIPRWPHKILSTKQPGIFRMMA